MSVLFGRGSGRSKQINDKLVPPKGWFTAEELQRNYVTNEDEKSEEIEQFIRQHLPMAARRAERLIDAIERKLNIDVPESSLRVRADGAFQVLLLVNQADFLSPKMAAARILAEEFANTQAYDLAFTFSVLSESILNNTALAGEFRLKYIQQHFANTSPSVQHSY